MSYAGSRSEGRLLTAIDAFVKREGRAPSYTEMEAESGFSRAYCHRLVGRLVAAGKLRHAGRRGNFELVGSAMPDPGEVRECLLRLKTECEVEGLDARAGFDCWVAWANRLLGTTARRSAPGDRREGVAR